MLTLCICHKECILTTVPIPYAKTRKLKRKKRKKKPTRTTKQTEITLFVTCGSLVRIINFTEIVKSVSKLYMVNFTESVSEIGVINR